MAFSGRDRTPEPYWNLGMVLRFFVSPSLITGSRAIENMRSDNETVGTCRPYTTTRINSAAKSGLSWISFSAQGRRMVVLECSALIPGFMKEPAKIRRIWMPVLIG